MTAAGRTITSYADGTGAATRRYLGAVDQGLPNPKTAERVTGRERDAVRLPDGACEPVSDIDGAAPGLESAVGAVRTQVRLQKLDFWLRNPTTSVMVKHQDAGGNVGMKQAEIDEILGVGQASMSRAMAGPLVERGIVLRSGGGRGHCYALNPAVAGYESQTELEKSMTAQLAIGGPPPIKVPGYAKRPQARQGRPPRGRLNQPQDAARPRRDCRGLLHLYA